MPGRGFVRTILKLLDNSGKKISKLDTAVLKIMPQSTLWQYGLWSFQTGGTKLKRFVHKNLHTQRKLLYFENWINGGLRSFQKSEF